MRKPDEIFHFSSSEKEGRRQFVVTIYRSVIISRDVRVRSKALLVFAMRSAYALLANPAVCGPFGNHYYSLVIDEICNHERPLFVWASVDQKASCVTQRKPSGCRCGDDRTASHGKTYYPLSFGLLAGSLTLSHSQ